MKVPVVIDTNILISGYLWKGTPRKVIRFARSENYELLYCTESMTELVRILSDKFHMDVGEIIREIREKGSKRGLPLTLNNFEQGSKADPFFPFILYLRRQQRPSASCRSSDLHSDV